MVNVAGNSGIRTYEAEKNSAQRRANRLVQSAAGVLKANKTQAENSPKQWLVA